ncbi:DUF485 domain-containing protein [Amycolatopsis suaedae]|uniref:DUF485 domain-containing protein n=1 Tax=Amycolatopsis suaedae TaxID=2510978 RepID=A0A4Q7J8I9_9PSEU|nr:DUF485 domain-containing protein [Amycolatopsis suaedae]RZQ63162.1 DUF485 domain-containing protein [Amycolatopsis suaedae]
MQNVTRNALEDTGQIPALFADGGAAARPRTAGPPPGGSEPDYVAIQNSQEFATLRRRLRGFVFPVSLLFFAWYLTYVLLAAYAHDFMSTRVFGSVNVAILLGIAQFASTVLIMVAYLRYARRRIDPQVAEIRSHVGMDRDE